MPDGLWNMAKFRVAFDNVFSDLLRATCYIWLSSSESEFSFGEPLLTEVEARLTHL